MAKTPGVEPDFIGRFFLRHAAFLMGIYRESSGQSIWYYSTMIVAVVLSAWIMLFLTIVAAIIPGPFNLEHLSAEQTGIASAIVVALSALGVDMHLRRYKNEMADAKKWSGSRDGGKLFLTILSGMGAIVGHALVLWLMWAR